MVVGASAIERPEFSATSGEWVRLPALQAAVDIAGAQHFDKLRKRVGPAFEHRENTGDYRGVWFWLPGWLPAADKVRGSAPVAAAERAPFDHAERLKKAQADTAEHHLARLRGEVIPLDELNEILFSVLSAFRRAGEQMGRISPDAQQLVIQALEEARKTYRSRFNGHSDSRITASEDV